MASIIQSASNRRPQFSGTWRRGSTSQMCLHKILNTIINVPPPPSSPPPVKESSAENDSSEESKGLSSFDLNAVGYSVSPEMTEDFDGDRRNSNGGDAAAEREEREKGVSRISVAAEGSLGLLIEAAELILGDSIVTESARQSAGSDAAEMGKPPSSPVERSTRRRTRVLPNKYKNSVLESLTPSKRRRR